MFNLPVTIARKSVGFTMVLVWLFILLARGNTNAQSNERIASPEQSFRAAISAQMTAAAANARVTLLPGAIAYAGGDGGFVVNTAVEGVDRLDLQSSARGMDLLFVYVGASGLTVPEGYYKVRLVGKQAQFIAADGKVTATLPANVGQSTIAARSKVKVKLTVSWGKNGPEFDVEITFGAEAARSVSIPISETPRR